MTDELQVGNPPERTPVFSADMTSPSHLHWPSLNVTPPNHHRLSSSNLRILTETVVARDFNLYYRGTVQVLGIVGNILSLVVMLRANMRNVTTFCYLAVIAFCDTCILVIAVLYWLQDFDIHLLDSPWPCRLGQTLFFFSIHTSVTMLVAMTTEKFIVVWFPLKAASICTLKKARRAIGILVIMILGLNINHIFTRPDVTNNRNVTTCITRTLVWSEEVYPGLRTWHLLAWPWIDAIIYSFIPLTSLSVLNLLIIWKLRKSVKDQMKLVRPSKHLHESGKEMGESDQRPKSRYHSKPTKSPMSKAQNQVTVMLLLVTTAFIILTLPVAVMLIAERNWTPKDKREAAIMGLLYNITAGLMYTNHAINFFLYCLSGCRFRRELIAIFCVCRTRVSPNFNTPDTGGSAERSSRLSCTF